MADNIKVTEGAGPPCSTEEVTNLNGAAATAQHLQRVIAALRTGDGTAVDISNSNRLPVTVAGEVSDPGATGALEVIQEALEGTVAVVFAGPLPGGSNNIGKVDPQGNVAHDVTDVGNPIKMGGRARTELPAAVAQNDRVDAMYDKHGRQLIAPAPLDQRVSSTLNRTNTEAGQLLAAVASTAYVVTAITVINAHATVGTKVEIVDGASVKWKGYAGPLGGGVSAMDPNGLFVGSANTKLEGRCVTTGADVDIFVSAYKVPA